MYGYFGILLVASYEAFFQMMTTIFPYEKQTRPVGYVDITLYPDALSYYDTRYNQYMEQFRFYGNMRAKIAWAPATITVAVIAFLQRDTESNGIQVNLIVILFTVLTLIFAANVYLHRMQVLFLYMARECERYIANTTGETKLPLKTFSEIRSDARRQHAYRGDLFEGANVSLFLFFSALGILVLLHGS